MQSRGRCLFITKSTLSLINESGTHSYDLKTPHPHINPGDIVIRIGEEFKVLTKNISGRTKWTERILEPRRIKAMRIRSQVEHFTRDFFLNGHFHEVTTPLLVKSPGMEPHIDPFQLTSGQFLPSSPELSMKKLLVGGLDRIFQISPAFRNEIFTSNHRPEFTMLEFYRAFSNDEEIQKDVESLVENLALKILGKREISFREKQIDVSTPWPRLKINELFKEYVKIDLTLHPGRDDLNQAALKLGIKTEISDSWDDIYFRIWIDHIEPKLPQARAVFVTHYPASQAALANLTTDSKGCTWARRFEAYLGGLELCNGFDELTDSRIQRQRFEEEMTLRSKLTANPHRPSAPIDEDFLAALEEGMPPSGGVAIGFDRLVMLLAGEEDIEYCHWLNPQAELN